MTDSKTVIDVVRPFFEAIRRDPSLGQHPPTKLSSTEVGELMAEADKLELRMLGVSVLHFLAYSSGEVGQILGWRLMQRQGRGIQRRLDQMLRSLEHRNLSWDVAYARAALTHAMKGPLDWDGRVGLRFALSAAEAASATGGVEELREDLVGLRAAISSSYLPPSERTLANQRISRMLGDKPAGWEHVLTDGDGWGRAIKAALCFVPVDDLAGLLVHLSAHKGKRSERWEQQMASRLDGEGVSHAFRVLIEEIPRHERDIRTTTYGSFTFEHPSDLLDGRNVEVARGAIWAAALCGEDWVAKALRDTAAFCGTPPPGGGTVRSEKLANACVGALGRLDTNDAVSALAWLQSRIKNRPIRKVINRSLTEIASKTGVSPSRLLERNVASLGLNEQGERIEQLGEHVATLRLEHDALILSFETATGRSLRSTPAAIKKDHSDEFAELKTVLKESKKTLTAERSRLESLLAVDRTWEFDEWAELYLRHPVTGHFARRLLWCFGAVNDWVTLLPGEEGKFIDARGSHVGQPPRSHVQLWHPIRDQATAIAAWRSLLVERQIRQPFKQAFREVYRLTPAEVETDQYSNRFAAHILRYPQMRALVRTRGWNTQVLGYWDGGDTGEAAREFPDAHIRSVFYFDAVREGDEGAYDMPALCSTDQVRFQRLVSRVWERTPLANIPPLVFSEAMRDVDLFVGVTSIAADPQWIDRGVNRRFDPYWESVSFGDLAESAVTRRAALERLLPRTKIADRCAITDRYLVVHGKLRTYKIHFGSGNILMEPDDTYLCIVPAHGRALSEKLFLPFEEDGGLLSHIMSKAFLLADDDMITDKTILNQLRLR